MSRTHSRTVSLFFPYIFVISPHTFLLPFYLYCLVSSFSHHLCRPSSILYHFLSIFSISSPISFSLCAQPIGQTLRDQRAIKGPFSIAFPVLLFEMVPRRWWRWWWFFSFQVARLGQRGCAIDLCCGATFCVILSLKGFWSINATLKEGEGGRKSNPKLWVSGALGCNLTLLSRKISGFWTKNWS